MAEAHGEAPNAPGGGKPAPPAQPRARWLAGWLNGLRVDVYRIAANRASLPCDLVGWQAAAAIQLCLLVGKTLIQEQRPLLAAVNASHALLALALAALIRRRPQLYEAHREVLLFLASAHLSWVTFNGALRGGTNILAEHGGSPLRLLVLLLLASPPTNLCLYALYARLTLAWNMAALPLLAAAPALLYGGPMCRRMLEVPGIEAPLDSLHSLLGLAHSAIFQLSPRGDPPPPLRQCWEVHAWALLAVGALLPLLVLRRWESRARQHWEARQRERAAAAKAAEEPTTSSGGSKPQKLHADAPKAADATAEPGTVALRPPGFWVVEPWLASCLLWHLTSLGAAVLAPAA